MFASSQVFHCVPSTGRSPNHFSVGLIEGDEPKSAPVMTGGDRGRTTQSMIPQGCHAVIETAGRMAGKLGHAEGTTIFGNGTNSYVESESFGVSWSFTAKGPGEKASEQNLVNQRPAPNGGRVAKPRQTVEAAGQGTKQVPVRGFDQCTRIGRHPAGRPEAIPRGDVPAKIGHQKAHAHGTTTRPNRNLLVPPLNGADKSGRFESSDPLPESRRHDPAKSQRRPECDD